MASIVTLTLNPTVDKSCAVDQVVAERKLRCDEPRFDPGGGGINVARAIKELGGESAAFWTCGGAIGGLLEELLDKEGIDHHPIPIGAMTRENLIVFEGVSEDQYRFGMPGARLSEAEIRSCLEHLSAIDPPPEYLVLSGSIPPGVDDGVYKRIIQSMPESCRVVLDTSGRPLKLGLESSVYLIKPNLRELELLSNRPIEGESQIREVTQTLIGKDKAQVVITSLGRGGAFLTTADEHRHFRAPVVKIRSKVGAGDSTVAGLVLALSQGRPLPDAVQYGVAAGSAAVMTGGTELCRKEDVEKLYREMIRGRDSFTRPPG